MGKYWNKIWKATNTSAGSISKSNRLSVSTDTIEGKLELALHEIDVLKKRVFLLEHTVEQQLVHPPSSPTLAPAPMYSTKSLPRYLHHQVVTSPPPSSPSPVKPVTCGKGAAVKASVFRHRSLNSNDNF